MVLSIRTAIMFVEVAGIAAGPSDVSLISLSLPSRLNTGDIIHEIFCIMLNVYKELSFINKRLFVADVFCQILMSI